MGEQGGREEGEPEGEARAARAGPLGSLWGSSLAVLSHSFPTGNGMRLPATSGLEDCTRMGVGVLSVGPGEVGVCDCRVCAERPGRVDWRRVSAPRANCGVLRRRDKRLVFTDSLQSPERSRAGQGSFPAQPHHGHYGNVPPVGAPWAGPQPRRASAVAAATSQRLCMLPLLFASH